MKNEKRITRRAEIEAAAYSVLQENGYSGTSMLTVAKAAKASNETLYRWYGDKQGLFAALIERHAETLKGRLEGALTPGTDPIDGLRTLAPALLAALTSDQSTTLNRAAATDSSGELGRLIAKGRRRAIAPLIGDLIGRALATGKIEAPNPHQAAEWYMALVVGDAQIRRTLGLTTQPNAEVIRNRTEAAVTAFLKLAAPTR